MAGKNEDFTAGLGGNNSIPAAVGNYILSKVLPGESDSDRYERELAAWQHGGRIGTPPEEPGLITSTPVLNTLGAGSFAKMGLEGLGGVIAGKSLPGIIPRAGLTRSPTGELLGGDLVTAGRSSGNLGKGDLFEGTFTRVPPGGQNVVAQGATRTAPGQASLGTESAPLMLEGQGVRAGSQLPATVPEGQARLGQGMWGDDIIEGLKRMVGGKGSPGTASRTEGTASAGNPHINPDRASTMEQAGMRATNRAKNGAGTGAAEEGGNFFSNLPVVKPLLAAFGLGPAMLGDDEPPADVRLPPDLAFLGVGGPDGNGGLVGSGGGADNFAFPPNIVTEHETLPETGWDSIPMQDTEAFIKALRETRPEEPEERDWFQDLASWVGPGLAMGILLGPAGLALGGLMGEGSRRSANQRRDAAYEDELNDWKADIASKILAAQGLDRKQILQNRQGIRSDALEDINLDMRQDSADREATALQNDRAFRELQGRNIQSQMQQRQFQNQLRQALLGGVAGQADPKAILDQIVQTNPELLPEISAMPAFIAWQNAVGTGNTLDPVTQMQADANLSQLILQLEANPRYAELVRALKGQNQMTQLFKQL